jgi:hypothetical protein
MKVVSHSLVLFRAEMELSRAKHNLEMAKITKDEFEITRMSNQLKSAQDWLETVEGLGVLISYPASKQEEIA